MKFIISILLTALIVLQAQGQETNPFNLSIGANYSLRMSSNEGVILIDPYSYSPQLEINAGMNGFEVFARLGNISTIGVKTGNSFALVGVAYDYAPLSIAKQNHVVSFEFTLHKEVFKNATLYVYTKHGFNIYDFKYVFSPINVGLTFRLN